MTRMHLFAKLILTTIGISIFATMLDSIELLARTVAGRPLYNEIVFRCVFSAVFFIAGFVFIYYLLFHSDNLIKKIVGPTANNNPVEFIWIITGFHVVFMFCGLLLLRGSVNFLIKASVFIVTSPKILVDMLVYKYVDDMFRLNFYEWIEVILKSCRAILGIYLLMGAPHFIRRQIRNFRTSSAS